MPFRIRTSVSSIATLRLSSLFISIRRLYVSKICRWYLEKPTNQTGHSACFPKFIISLSQAWSEGQTGDWGLIVSPSVSHVTFGRCGVDPGRGLGLRVWTAVGQAVAFSWGLCW